MKPYYLIDGEALAALERVQQRLHAIGGDALDGAASTVQHIVRTSRALPVPEDAILATCAAASDARRRGCP
jgi:hypothetical protein